MDEKRCSKCGKVKPISEFSKNKHAKDGMQFHCTDCKKEYYRKGKETYAILHWKPNKKLKNDKRITCYVDKNLHKELTREARKYSMSVSQLLMGAVSFYFDNYKD